MNQEHEDEERQLGFYVCGLWEWACLFRHSRGSQVSAPYLLPSLNDDLQTMT